MKKIEILPKVNVYRNLLDEESIKFLVETINKSNDFDYSQELIDPKESAYSDKHGIQPAPKPDGSVIHSWAPWYTFGTRSKFEHNSSNSNSEEQVAKSIILQVLNKAHEDYSNQWKDDPEWPEYIEYWNMGGFESDMSFSELEILRHKTNNPEEYAIGVHTDWHEQRLDEPGPKQIVTYTIYLNDDYEGGEIDFVDENNKKLISYKPKRGDITAFPSGRPYWHAAKAVKSGSNKLFIRTFALWSYSGSREWLDGLKRYGLRAWTDIQNEKIKSFVDMGNVGRQIVIDNNKPVDDKNLVPLFVDSKNITYIDGREI